MDEDEFVLKAIGILQRKVERLKHERDQAVARGDDLQEELDTMAPVPPYASPSTTFSSHSWQTARLLPFPYLALIAAGIQPSTRSMTSLGA